MSDVIRIDNAEAGERRPVRPVPPHRLVGPGAARRARVLVIGAGALGNEILKDLALLGVGRVFVADRDRVENSNLSRSILFRERDCGRPKAEVAAERAVEIYPEMRVRPFTGNVVYDLGLGVYRWADVILGGLDNREARVAINQATARAGKVWIDGAIERLDGVARVFDPATGPCYECTMGENDWKMLEARRSCALLSRGEMEQGKVPTTPTTASIVAGIQVQEAVKYLHGLDVIAGQGFVFDGTHHQSYLVRYTRKEDCPAHEADESVEPLPGRRRRDPGRRPARAGPLRPGPRGGHRGRPRPAGLAPLRGVRRGGAGLRLARPGHRGPGPMPPMRTAPDPLDVPHHRRPTPGPPRHDPRRHRHPPLGRPRRPRRLGTAVLRTHRRSCLGPGVPGIINHERYRHPDAEEGGPAGRDLPRRPERGVPGVFHPRGARRAVEARRRGHVGGDLRRAGGDLAPRRGRAVREDRRLDPGRGGRRPSSPR